MNVRLNWLRNQLTRMNMDGMIVTNQINIQYLTGIEAEGILLITPKENIYVTDARYVESVNSILTIDDEIIVMDIRDISIYDYENFFTFCENIGFEENNLTYAQYQEYKHKYKINNFVETDNIVEKQRIVKDQEEIDKIEQACKITDKCFSHLLEFIKKGMTEKEIAYEIQRYFVQNGADGLAFDSVVASRTKFFKTACSTNR